MVVNDRLDVIVVSLLVMVLQEEMLVIGCEDDGTTLTRTTESYRNNRLLDNKNDISTQNKRQ
jgi:hypothetical protein